MSRIPPPEELARRPAPTAFALAALDGARQFAAAIGVVGIGCALILGFGWTSLRFGQWVYSVVAAWADDRFPLSPLVLIAGGAATVGMFFALMTVVCVVEWIEARAGHTMPSPAKLACMATWWAIACGAVWVLVP